MTIELESVLFECGFNEVDAKIIIGEFLSGVANVGEANGATENQPVKEVLTGEQVVEILSKVIDDRVAALPSLERPEVNLEMLEQKLGYC